MYYPSSASYTTQSMKKFRRSNQKEESGALIQDYQTQRLAQQNQELHKELQQAQQDIITCEKMKREAEERLYAVKLKYDDASKELQNLKEKIVKVEGDKKVIQAESVGEIRALRMQISQLEQDKISIKKENDQLKVTNEKLEKDIHQAQIPKPHLQQYHQPQQPYY